MVLNQQTGRFVNGALSRFGFIFLRDALDCCRWHLKHIGNTRLVLNKALVYHARLRKVSGREDKLEQDSTLVLKL